MFGSWLMDNKQLSSAGNTCHRLSGNYSKPRAEKAYYSSSRRLINRAMFQLNVSTVNYNVSEFESLKLPFSEHAQLSGVEYQRLYLQR